MSDKMMWNIEEYRQNKPNIKTDTDTAFYHTILDSLECGEPLKPLEKPIFDTEKPIDRTDVKESLILKLLYSPKLSRL